MPTDKVNRGDAESIGIAALGFIASDTELMDRFLAISGIEPSLIRKAAGVPGFLAGVLDFLLAHEPTLLRFVDETGYAPASVLAARRNLPTGDDKYDIST